MTEAFKANVSANVDFLAASSRLAESHAQATATRDYARAEALDADRMVAALDIMFAAPVAVAAADEVQTGRSVATGPALGQAANGRAPLGRADLDQLGKLGGRKFEDAFWLKQLDALSQLRADYKAYADHGDDPALVVMSKRELAAVERRLAALTRI